MLPPHLFFVVPELQKQYALVRFQIFPEPFRILTAQWKLYLSCRIEQNPVPASLQYPVCIYDIASVNPDEPITFKALCQFTEFSRKFYDFLFAFTIIMQDYPSRRGREIEDVTDIDHP